MNLDFLHAHIVALISIFAALLHVLGIVSSAHALMTVRTSQGAIAWAMSLITFPYAALPLYWVFGRNKFQGYVNARRRGNQVLHKITESLEAYTEKYSASLDGSAARHRVLEELAQLPFTTSNSAELLIDGRNTFEAIFKAIRESRRYILLQFFIIHDDNLGRELQALLIEKAQQGVSVYLLYDEVGCHKVPQSYGEELRAAGVDVRPFNTRKGWRNRFQVNFRNHRKIVIIDGRLAFVGGLNVGDEYMGRSPRFGPWRDTHARFEGPSVTCVQLSFLEDWYWASHSLPELEWQPQAAATGNQHILVLPTGPADEHDTCSLFFCHAIHSARRRVWIVSPYFVPDEAVISALQVAALRGVDVRIMLPLRPDHRTVYLASFSYLPQFTMPGIRFYRYKPGFLHQKVLLVDDDLASVGTANLDNRSLKLNFEISMVVNDRGFVADVEKMLETDFANCIRVTLDDYHRRSPLFKLAVKVARLLSPIL